MSRYLTEKQAADFTGFSVSWFQKKRCYGDGHKTLHYSGLKDMPCPAQCTN